ncbi:MAG: helicase-exonuclease AddAB subunit AddA [Oscillospiraceae bacterium]|nr:helicase-exonuclease AddAB subunit AddA [Oscillospiraceae bacterium]
MEKNKVMLTAQQRLAVETTGGELLVSAAAGSGKTKVLVERLLRQITDSRIGADIDDFLVITYTRAAAAELRGKIMDAISERLATEPKNRLLRRQLGLCRKAQISTIHGFCSSLIRENAHMIGVAPDFRIAEETELAEIKQTVLDRLLDSRYEAQEAHPGFTLLVDTMSAGRDDSKIAEITLRLHAAVMSHPYPKKWLETERGRLALDGVSDLKETPWGEYLLQKTKSAVAYWRRRLERLCDEASLSPDFAASYGAGLSEQAARARAFEDALAIGWDSAFGASDMSKVKVCRISGYDDLKKERDRCVAGLQKAASVLAAPSKELLEDMRETAPAVDELLSLAADFDAAFSDEKRRRSIMDYSDLEHIALELLTDENGERTPLAIEVSARFREILIDEYQDVNAVQELIFRAASRGGENIFTVGDVKQSIYKFRLADPSIFLEKYLRLPDAEDAAEGEGRRVILSKNFRSRGGVLDAVNYIFKNIMSAEFGEMDYTPSEYLYQGAEYAEREECDTELYVIDAPDGDDTPDAGEAEAEFIAARIEELLQSGEISDGAGGARRIKYGDIAILLRSVKGRQRRYAHALEKRGIPCAAGKSAEFLSTVEISVISSLLSVIDNPRQDIPLVSVLRSPVYGFTADDLAEIRLADRDSDIWSALKKASEKGERYAAFVEEIESYRDLAPDMSASELIWHIYSRTGMPGVMSAMTGGAERYENLMLFLEEARRFERSGRRGLYAFNCHIKKMMDDGTEPERSEPVAAVNAVTITSIHKSKGLEYPVVFLADTAKEFNQQDTRERLLIHPKLGVGAKRLDLERRLEYPTVPRLAIAAKIKSETLAEELRVLYVAMTRAREKLIITCAYKDAEKTMQKLRRDSSLPVEPQVLEDSKSVAEWLLLAAMQRPEACALRAGECGFTTDDCGKPWRIELVEGGVSSPFAESAETPEKREADREKVLEIAERVNFLYAHAAATNVPSKLTATELKGRYGEAEAAEDAYRTEPKLADPELKKPDFLGGDKPLTGAERGVAMHTAMRYIDIEQCTSEDGVRSEIARMEREGLLTRNQAEAVSAEKIYRFFASETGAMVRGADEVRREFKFLLLVPAEEFYADCGDEKILLQGVADCCVEKDGKLTIIDYKTDYVDENNIAEKIDLYRGQLGVYSRAMGEIFGKTVERRVIYFFSKGIAAEV